MEAEKKKIVEKGVWAITLLMMLGLTMIMIIYGALVMNGTVEVAEPMGIERLNGAIFIFSGLYALSLWNLAITADKKMVMKLEKRVEKLEDEKHVANERESEQD